MPRIRLVKPTLAHESAIRAYLDAVHAAGLPLRMGSRMGCMMFLLLSDVGIVPIGQANDKRQGVV